MPDNAKIKSTEIILQMHRKEIDDNELRIEKLEDSFQKAGTKWDFRLDELNGFIEEIKEQLEEYEKRLKS